MEEGFKEHIEALRVRATTLREKARVAQTRAEKAEAEIGEAQKGLKSVQASRLVVSKLESVDLTEEEDS